MPQTALRQTARNIPFTMIFYITVSGKGFRILLRYMRPEGCNLTATELHLLAIRKAMSMYDKLLGISCDKQCQDMVRSCGLAYDPEAYFNWNAEVLAITREEVEEFEKATKQQEEQNRKRQTEAEKPRKKSPRKQEDEAPPKTLTTEEILQYVDKLAESWEERTGLRPRGLLQLECRSSRHHLGGGGELRKSYKATGGTEQEKADGG